MLYFTSPELWDTVKEDIGGFPFFPDSQRKPAFPESDRKQGRTLIYRAIRWCNDMTILEKVFDIYLKIYPAAIHGSKDGWLDRMPESITKKEERYCLPESWKSQFILPRSTTVSML